MVRKNYNRCDKCWDDEELIGFYDFAICSETGICGECGLMAEVYDYQLLCVYLMHEFTVDDIWKYLPRLRLYPNGKRYSLSDIHERMREVEVRKIKVSA